MLSVSLVYSILLFTQNPLHITNHKVFQLYVHNVHSATEQTSNIILFFIPFIGRILKDAIETEYININCVDPLGRSALLMAIDNENLEMVELLINFSVDTKDALLHAISEEFVEAVEMLLDHEDSNHSKEGHHVSYLFVILFDIYNVV